MVAAHFSNIQCAACRSALCEGADPHIISTAARGIEICRRIECAKCVIVAHVAGTRLVDNHLRITTADEVGG